MYLLDSNIFIQAKNFHYSFDFCPAFWEWLIEKHTQNKVFTIKEVKDEIDSGNDELTQWFQKTPDGFSIEATSDVIDNFSSIEQWLKEQSYQSTAISDFQKVADYYLIANALQYQATIVTHEKSTDTLKKIKIPNVCTGLSIEWISPFTMLKQEQAKFVLPSVSLNNNLS